MVQYKFKSAQTFQFDETNINYAVEGSGEKAVLFLHGFGLSMNSWGNLNLENWLDHHKFVFLDFKGFGFSDKPKNSDYSVEEQVRIIVALLKHLNITNLSVVGHSYGGIVAYSLINEVVRGWVNLKIEKKIFIDSPVYEPISPYFIKILQIDFLSFLALNLIPKRIIAKSSLKTSFYNYNKAKKNYLERYVFFFKQKGINYSMRKIAKNILPKNLAEIQNSLKELNGDEVLIIWGENDTLISKDYGIKLANDIKNSELVFIANCGHVPQEEKPEETAKIIYKFLSK